MWKFLKKYEYKILQFVAFGFLGIGVVVLLWFILLVSINYEQSANFDPVITQTVGVFIGGVVPVFISIATVLLIYITFKSNREEFNKISAANDFQQFNITFDSMYNSLEKIIENFSKRQILSDYVGSAFSEIRSLSHGVILNYLNIPENDINLIVGEKYNAVDKKIIAELKKMNSLNYQSEIQALTSGINLIFKYFENHSNNKLKTNNEFYLLRIKYLVSKKEVCNSIMFNSITDKELYNYVNKYNLIEKADENIPIKFSHSDHNSNRVIPYKFSIRYYIKENSFHK